MKIETLHGKTLDAYMDLIRDASPSSGTHWSRCRGAQRVYARDWLTTFDAKRKARRQARRAQVAMYCISAILIFYIILTVKGVWK